MCLYYQAPDEAAETVNLSQKVSIATPEETAPVETEEEKPLPEWSEKVANGILTGEIRLSSPTACCFCLLQLLKGCLNPLSL